MQNAHKQESIEKPRSLTFIFIDFNFIFIDFNIIEPVKSNRI